MKRVILQLDYYLGGQFAGLATGLARGLFASRGLDVSIVAPCPPGAEGAAVVERQRAANATVLEEEWDAFVDEWHELVLPNGSTWWVTG